MERTPPFSSRFGSQVGRHISWTARFLWSTVSAFALTVAVMVASGGAASAFRAVAGSGVHNSSASVSIVQTSKVTDLYPGATRILSGHFENRGAVKVSVKSVHASVVTFQLQRDGTHRACTQGDFAVSGTSRVSAHVPPGTDVGSWSGLILSMKDSAPSNCAGAHLTISYRLG
jgi:hypothetical protein